MRVSPRKASMGWVSPVGLIRSRPSNIMVITVSLLVLFTFYKRHQVFDAVIEVQNKEIEKQHCALYKADRQGSFVCGDCTSQRNQDKILENIFQHIGTTNRQCVEFGFGYVNTKSLRMDDLKMGKKLGSGLNVHALVRDGWTPTFFDAEYENKHINLHKKTLTPETIGQEFKEAGIPIDVDYVSIDVDSIDVWLFHGLLESGYRPRVVSVEYNPNIPMNMTLTCERKWAPWQKRFRVYGAGASAINFVAEMFGYRVVEIMPKLDMFFVRSEILDGLCTPDSLPSYHFLASGMTGVPNHSKCSLQEINRLVDFPLSLQGREADAKEKARKSVTEINEIFVRDFGHPFCSY